MMSRNGSSSAPFASRGNHRPDDIIPWETSQPVIDGIISLWTDSYRYILVIADYFSKWTEAFPIKNKCAATVADVLAEKIILHFASRHT